MHIGPRNWNMHFFDLQDESHYQELDTVDPYISQLFLTRKRATMYHTMPHSNKYLKNMDSELVRILQKNKLIDILYII